VALHVRVLSSVRSDVLDDLVATIARAPGLEASLCSAIDADGWMRARGGDRIRSTLMRLRGLFFPLTVDLHGRCGGCPADVIVATTNPFWLPTVVAWRARVPVVALVYDVYPDSLTTRLRLPAPLVRLVDRLVGSGLRNADAVVMIGARMREALVARHALTSPTAVIVTGGDPAVFVDTPITDAALAARLEGRTVIGHVGNAGSVHDVVTLAVAIRAVHLARPGRTAVVIATRGDRAAELLDPLAGLPDVEVLPPLDGPTWRWLTGRIDVTCVGLGAASGVVSMPSRIHSTLAAGGAVLAVAPEESDLADLVRGSGAGVVVASGDVDAATAALAALIDDTAARADHKAAARRAAERSTPEALAGEWADVITAAREAHRHRGRRAHHA
jgi:glycosyltransferase involved in cell wall biosynthesis